MKTLTKSMLVATVSVMALSAQAQAEELIFAHGANPGNPRYDAANMFAELVPACTGGEMTVNVAPSATMGDDAEMLTSATAGVIQMTANSQGTMAQIVPEIGALGLPFLFEDLPTVWRVLDGPIGDELDEKAQNSGLKIIAFWDNGIRHVTHVDKHVESPADIAGMKIRTPPDQVTIDTFEALGANPAPLAWSELPTALQSGVFDGQENPLTNIYTANLHEITPYISMTGHKYETTPVVAGLAWWNSLSEDSQTCIENAAEQAGWYQRGRSMADAKALVDVMKGEGAQFAEVDREAYAEATAPVYGAYQQSLGDFVSRLQSAASGGES